MKRKTHRYSKLHQPQRSGPGRYIWIGLVLTVLAGCGGGSDTSTPAEPAAVVENFDPATLPSPETFAWGSQPIAVSPPPDDWRRDRAQSGGLRGVRFIKSRSFGEEIRIAEHYALDDRLRCSEQMELLQTLDDVSRSEFNRGIQRARLYVPEPINMFEERSAENANESLDDAREAFQNDDVRGARRALRSAMDNVRSIRYNLSEVVDRVMFDSASYDSFGTVEIMPPESGFVGGVPAISVDYTLDSDSNGHLYYGRQVYVLEDNRLFVLSFHGLRHNLALFEAIVDSVTFPRSLCEA